MILLVLAWLASVAVAAAAGWHARTLAVRKLIATLVAAADSNNLAAFDKALASARRILREGP